MAKSRMEMPGDVRRMTAEMRKAHDNPDPRPQLRRGNPKAVSAAEAKAQLRALRDGESSPEQVALRGYAQALREGKVVEGGLGAAVTIAPMVAGMFAGGPGASRRFSLYHALDGAAFLKAVESGSLVQPSLAIARAHEGTPIIAGYASKTPNYPTVIIKAPASVIKGNRNAIVFSGDGGTPTMSYLRKAHEAVVAAGAGTKLYGREIPKGLASASFDEVLRDRSLRSELYEFARPYYEETFPSTARILRDGVVYGKNGEVQSFRGDFIGSGDPLPESYGRGIGESAVDFSSPDTKTAEYYLHGYTPYGEAKVFGDVDLAGIWRNGGGVIVRAPRENMVGTPEYKAVIDRVKGLGVPYREQVVKDPVYHEYRIPGSTDVELLTDPNEEVERLHPKRWATDADELGNDFSSVRRPRTGTFAASKGGNAPGEAGPGKRESTAPTDEQLQEAAAFLRLVIEKGFARTDDEITKCERLARAIEAAVGAEPVEPREEPLRQAPLQGQETQAAIGAGETEEDKDLFGQNGTVEITDQDAKDFAANAAPDNFGQNGTVEITDQDAKDFAANAAPDNFGQNGTVETTEQDAKDFAGATAPQQEATRPAQQETLAPGLSRSGSRNNILEFNGRRISQREFDRIQAKSQEGPGRPTGIGGRALTAGEAAWQAKRQSTTGAWMARTGQNAGVPGAQVAMNGGNDPLKPNNLRQSTQVDSGRRDALGRPLDEYGRVIA